MKSFPIVLVLAAFAVAYPSPVDNEASARALQTRQSRLNRDELLENNGAECPSAIFIYARGSTERGNMV